MPGRHAELPNIDITTFNYYFAPLALQTHMDMDVLALGLSKFVKLPKARRLNIADLCQI